MRTIKVSSKALYQAKPDTVNFLITLISEGKEYDLVIEESSLYLEKLTKELIKAGFNLEDLVTTDFNLEHLTENYQENNQYKQKKVGYKIIHKMKLSFSLNYDLINKVIEVINKTNTNALFTIKFLLSNKEEAKKTLLEKAYKTAFSDAETLAKISNNKLGEVLEINYNFDNLNFESPFVLRSNLELNNRLNFNPEEIKLEEKVQVIFKII